MTGRRRWSFGLADQAVIAAANAGNALLATVVLAPGPAGVVLVSIATTYVAMGINRAFIGDVLLTQGSRFEGARHRRMFNDALACAAVSGLVIAAVLTLIWLLWPGDLLTPLIYIVPFIPAIFLHDTARYAYQSQLRQDHALVIDVVWVVSQSGAVAVGSALDLLSGPWLLASWGVGATVAVAIYLLRGGLRPWHGRPGRWLAGTRQLSGWFTATALIGQTQTQLIALAVPGLLGAPAYAGLRLAQLAVLQPVQNFVLAAMGLLVPRAAQLAEQRDTAGFAALIRRLTAVGTGLAAVVITVVVLASGPLLEWYRDGEYADTAGALVWPIALQAGAYLLQLPFTAALRGMQQGARLFAQYAVFTSVSLTAAALGAVAAGLRGTAWGLSIGAIVGVVVMMVFTRSALRQLRRPRPALPAAPQLEPPRREERRVWTGEETNHPSLPAEGVNAG